MIRQAPAPSGSALDASVPASAWSPFRHRAFAVLWVATVLSNIGTWMADVGAGWLMTTLSPSPEMVALVQAATALPMFLFALAQCQKLMESPFPVNPAGFVIHSAIHAAREDAQCVLHVHTVAGVAVSAQKHGVLPISQQSTLVLASLGYHDYEGIALLDDEKPRLVRDLGSNQFLMLRNHGLLTVGATIADAFLLMFTFQRTCEIQVAALAGNGAGDKLVAVDPKILAGVKQNVALVTKGMMGGLAWPGLLRKLDRESPGYKD
jgi:ribulose-5-phosphate 4-epimerase/fuculose-1-phosphate aldolase